MLDEEGNLVSRLDEGKKSIFEAEMNAFREDLPALLVHDKGKWMAYSVGEEPIGPLSTEQDCIIMGYNAWGTEQFLVKQISEEYLFGQEGRPMKYRHGIDKKALANR